MTAPVHTIRDGSVKATIWKNEGGKGDFYSVDISRTYTDESGAYHDATSFSGTELLKVSRISVKAYDWIADNK